MKAFVLVFAAVMFFVAGPVHATGSDFNKKLSTYIDPGVPNTADDFDQKCSDLTTTLGTSLDQIASNLGVPSDQFSLKVQPAWHCHGRYGDFCDKVCNLSVQSTNSIYGFGITEMPARKGATEDDDCAKDLVTLKANPMVFLAELLGWDAFVFWGQRCEAAGVEVGKL